MKRSSTQRIYSTDIEPNLGEFYATQFKDETIVAVPTEIAKHVWDGGNQSTYRLCRKICPLFTMAECGASKSADPNYEYGCMSNSRFGGIVWVPLHMVVTARIEGDLNGAKERASAMRV